MKTLLLIPSYAKRGLDADIAADRHPVMDYTALQRALDSVPGGEAVLLDFGAVEASTHPLVRAVHKLAGKSLSLAVLGVLQAGPDDVIFSNSEDVALPISLLHLLMPRRPRHVTIAHRLSPRKKAMLYRYAKMHRRMDVIFVYSTSQLRYAIDELGMEPDRVKLIQFHADHRFYRPTRAAEVDQICAAGLEWRDYPTLIDAVSDAPDLQVKLAAASPWSKHRNETEEAELPSNVDARRYEYGALRELYAQSSFVAVPLYENDFQAGITTILEGMAMGKAVVVTKTEGQDDVVQDGVTGIYVEPGDPQGWRKAIARLRGDRVLRARLGRNARKWLEDHATLDRWVDEISAAVWNTSIEAIRAKRGRSHVGPMNAAPSGTYLREDRSDPENDTERANGS